MKPKVYIETTVVSYLTALPSRDVVIAGHQQMTRDWWQNCRDAYELTTSQLAIREASFGDPVYAQKRLEILATMTLLDVVEEALALAQELVTTRVLPSKAGEDAMHLAVAVTSGVDYLLTWNYRHLANPAIRKQIDSVCQIAGFKPVIICTPEELLGK